MWPQSYAPVAGNLAGLERPSPHCPFSFCSTCSECAGPRRGLHRWPGSAPPPWWRSSFTACRPACCVSSIGYGAAFGLFPIAWVVFGAILLYRITVETGHFEILKDSIGSLTTDRHLQALLIAFAFGAFIEGAAGFGSPVAVAAAMLAGLGLLAVLRRRHLPAREHGAGGVRFHRHPDRHAGGRHRPAAPGAQHRCRPNLRTCVPHYSGLPGSRDGRAPGAAARASPELPFAEFLSAACNSWCRTSSDRSSPIFSARSPRSRPW